MNVSDTASIQDSLAASAVRLSSIHSRDLLRDTVRNGALKHTLVGCHFDFSRQRVDQQALAELIRFANCIDLPAKRDAMLTGARINRSENREVLHTALRQGAAGASESIKIEVAQIKRRLYKCVKAIRSCRWRGYTGKSIRDVIHIGIGGSHLGPELLVNALAHLPSSKKAPKIHFVANVDAQDINRALRGLSPETTLFIVVSKSFSTLETQVNANTARSWFLERTGNLNALGQHFLGVTNNLAAASEFGFRKENLFPIQDWVGGRFSLWSAVGLPIMLKIGCQAFEQLLEGARAADEHFAQSEIDRNIPMLAALLAIWNTSHLGCDSLAVLPYDKRLALLPDYLQQLEMESNGKSFDINGDPIDYRTMQVLWGGCGTNGQHAYHQLLHQGTSKFAADFILVGKGDTKNNEHHRWLLANGIAQGQAMTLGYIPIDQAEQFKRVRGNHPSTTIVLNSLRAEQIGCLLAIYEHKVFCQGVLWNINSFDQWGVELGKQMALPIFAQLSGEDASTQDPATRHLVDHCLGLNRTE